MEKCDPMDDRGDYFYSGDLSPVWQGWIIYYVIRPSGSQNTAFLARKWVPGDLFSPPNPLPKEATWTGRRSSQGM